MNNNGKARNNKCCQPIEDLMEPRFFKALADPTRVAILARLAGCCQRTTVSEVAKCFTVDVSVISRHLALLRDAGILEAERRGKQVYYSVRFPQLSRTLREMAEAIDACCPPDKGRVAKGG